MTFALVNESIGSSLGVSSHTENLPAAAAASNLLVSGVAVRSTATTPAITVPSGWTELINTFDGNAYFAVAYKVAAGGETGAAWTVGAAADNNVSCHVAQFSGNTSTPLDQQQNQKLNGTAKTSQGTGSTTTTSQDNELVVTYFGVRHVGSSSTGFSVATGFSTPQHLLASNVSLSTAWKRITTAGVQSGTWSWTNSQDRGVAYIVTFREAAAAPASGVEVYAWDGSQWV